MVESAITLSIVTIGCVIFATVLVTAIYPAMNRAASSAVSTTVKLGERIETSVEIVAEANETPYKYVWVKNTGASQLAPSEIERSDIIFGETGNFQRLFYDADLSSAPCWNITSKSCFITVFLMRTRSRSETKPRDYTRLHKITRN